MVYTLPVSSADLIKALKKAGWQLVRITGSHHHFKHPTRPELVTVPHPKKDIPTGTARAILKAAGLK
jgi:predicted RNA binding protein YcfA (HicA-like mRNA interferase family)